MPSPVAHGLAGLTLHALASQPLELRRLEGLGWVVGAAVISDVDLLFRLVDGQNHHNGLTHSLGFAVALGLVAALYSRLRGWARSWLFGGTVALATLSHVLLDYLNRDTHPPFGLMALWPLDSGHYNFPWPLFLDVGRSMTWEAVRYNAMAVTWEITVLLPLCFLAWRWGLARRRQYS